MKIKGKMAKILALAGTILIGTPILITIITSIIESFSIGKIVFNYLLPMKLFPLTAMGSILLFWSSSICRYRYKVIIYSIFAQVFLLNCGMIVASLSGLASGSIEATGFVWMVTVFIIILYYVVSVDIFVLGLLLYRDLVRNQNKNSSTDEKFSK